LFGADSFIVTSLSIVVLATTVGGAVLAVVLGYLALVDPRERAWRYWLAATLADVAAHVAAMSVDLGPAGPWLRGLVPLVVVWLFVRGLLAYRVGAEAGPDSGPGPAPGPSPDRPVGARPLDMAFALAGVLCVVALAIIDNPVLQRLPIALVGGGALVLVGCRFLIRRGRRGAGVATAAGIALILMGVVSVFGVWWRSPEPAGVMMFAGGHVLMALTTLLLVVSSLDARTRLAERALAEAGRSQYELEQANDRLTDFLGISTDWLWEQDADLRFTHTTDHTKSYVKAPEAVYGKTRREISIGGPTERDWHRHDETLAARQPINDFRYDIVDSFGRHRTISVSGRPTFDEAGEFTGYRGVSRDITEQVEAERRAKTIESQLLRSLESRTEGIAFFDDQDRFVICNQAYREHAGKPTRLLEPGLRFEDYLRAGVEMGGFTPKGYDPEAWVQWRLEQHRSPPMSYEFERDGRWVLIREQRTDDGGALISSNDITELKARENLLRQAVTQAEIANRTKMEFLATMSHELRTPLNAIIGFSDMMRTRGGHRQVEQLEEYAGYIHESGTHLLAVINDLLDVARIEAGKLKVDEHQFPITPLLQECERMVRHRAGENGIDLQINLAPVEIELRGDRRAMKQVLINLLSNAIKFTHDGGRVDLSSVLGPDGSLILDVDDTGIGVPVDRRERVFEPFQQVESAHSRRYQGTGLGLFISRNLIEAHQGTIVLTGNPAGQGSRVTVRIPADRVRVLGEGGTLTGLRQANS